MMFFQEADLLAITYKQYGYKLKAHMSFVPGLIVAQIIALLLSLGGVSGVGSGGMDLFVTINNYSANIVIVMTFIWLFAITTSIAGNTLKMDLTLVSNRLSGNLSNAGLLLTASIFGGLTASLFNVLLRFIIYFAFDRAEIISNGFYPSFADLLLGMALTILYMLLIAAAGYLFGVSKLLGILTIIILAAIIGLARTNFWFFKIIINFFTAETSPLLFTLKIIIAAIIIFGLSTVVSNRMEVK